MIQEKIEFEPRIVGFLCQWCSYAAADLAGTAHTPISANLSIVRLMCSGRVDPQFVLAAMAKGADGVLILGCHPGDCHYKEGNYRAAIRASLLSHTLAQLGIPKERCRFDFVSATEGERFAKIVGEMVEHLRELGPLNRSEGQSLSNKSKSEDPRGGSLREQVTPVRESPEIRLARRKESLHDQ